MIKFVKNFKKYFYSQNIKYSNYPNYSTIRMKIRKNNKLNKFIKLIF